MAVTMPNVDVVFRQYAASFIARSQRGIAILVVRDATAGAAYAMYNSLVEVSADDYTAANMQYIKDVFAFAPWRVAVIRIAAAGDFADAAAIIAVKRQLRTGWVTIADMTAEDSSDLASWIKSQELAKKYYKAITYKAAVTDSRHIVNFYNESVTFADARGAKTGAAYLPSLLGILASCNVTRGATFYKASNLLETEELADPDTAVASGKFILINDYETPKVAVGINSLTTTNGSTLTEDMKYIETVEAMDLIADDIRDVFLNEYAGNYRNSYDNQILFISAVNYYLRGLARDNILDPAYINKSDIDIAEQRAAWLGSGKTEAEEWADEQVRRMAFKRTVFLAGDIKILGSMEHLLFNVEMA